ncbi:hypothetical protein RIF29_39523 [Crotalaria pallida]|uniref:Uncharacterized protein n=1 Tax=Crotalaria pallida TaxID=3830 RepID=A0AAN9HTD5_CROPI
MGTDDNSNRVGLVISTTDSIRDFLTGASNDPNLSDELRRTSSDLLSQSKVPYPPLRAVWMASHPSTRPDLTRLFSGTRFVLSTPKPREKSEELKARLKKLDEIAERKAYQELVKDIAPKNDVVDEPFSSYKDQLGFGLHVLVTMFTGYLLGYAAFRALFNHSPAMNAAGGILGLVGAMFVETFLFIIRSSYLDDNKTRRSNQKPKFATSILKKNHSAYVHGACTLFCCFILVQGVEQQMACLLLVQFNRSALTKPFPPFSLHALSPFSILTLSLSLSLSLSILLLHHLHHHPHRIIVVI